VVANGGSAWPTTNHDWEKSCRLQLEERDDHKVAIFVGGKAKYPVSVSYGMGWQKCAKTYDSFSGQGLMIGDQTKRVVAFHNCLKACTVCHCHTKKIESDNTTNLLERKHHCQNNHDGSSKGMEAWAALECINKVWTHSEISAFIDIICLDDNASTKAYLHHSFADLEALLMPCPTDTKGRPNKVKTKKRQGATAEEPPSYPLSC
jgi:hypothetical protein